MRDQLAGVLHPRVEAARQALVQQHDGLGRASSPPWSRRSPRRRSPAGEAARIESAGRRVGQPRAVQVRPSAPSLAAPTSAARPPPIERAVFGGVGQRERRRRLACASSGSARASAPPDRSGPRRRAGHDRQAGAKESRRAGLVGGDMGVLVWQSTASCGATSAARKARWRPCRRRRSAPRRRRPAARESDRRRARRRRPRHSRGIAAVGRDQRLDRLGHAPATLSETKS